MRSSSKRRQQQELAGVIHLTHEIGVRALALAILKHGGSVEIEIAGETIEVIARRKSPVHVAASPEPG